MVSCVMAVTWLMCVVRQELISNISTIASHVRDHTSSLINLVAALLVSLERIGKRRDEIVFAFRETYE